MTDNTTLKRCTKCGDDYPATSMYFHSRKDSKDGLRNECKICKNNINADYTARHISENRQRAKAHYYQHTDQKLAYQRQYAKTHTVNIRDYQVNYRRKNNNTIRKYRQRNAARIHYTGAVWRKSHPDKVREHIHRRRARKHNAVGSHTSMDITILYINQRGLCAYCGCNLNNKYHVDHVIPLSRGGSDDVDNLALACPRCNHSKGSKSLSEWRR